MWAGEPLTELNLRHALDSISLISRDQGRKALEIVLAELENIHSVTPDFRDADAVSWAFVDELFRGLTHDFGRDLGERIKISTETEVLKDLIQHIVFMQNYRPN